MFEGCRFLVLLLHPLLSWDCSVLCSCYLLLLRYNAVVVGIAVDQPTVKGGALLPAASQCCQLTNQPTNIIISHINGL